MKRNPCGQSVAPILYRLATIIFIVLSLAADTAWATTGTTGTGASFDNRQPSLAIRYIICTQGFFPGSGDGSITSSNRADGYLGEIRAVAYDFAPQGWVFCEGQELGIFANIALFSLMGDTFGGDGISTFRLPDLRGRVPIGAGQGPGLPEYFLGGTNGSAQTALTVSNLPAHTHSVPGGNTASTGNGVPLDNLQPSRGLNFFIGANSDILIAVYNFQPDGYALCDGRTLPITGNEMLFGKIGTNYGGNGTTNFKIPDLRGRAVINEGQGMGLSAYVRGQASGIVSNTVSVGQMPAHTHTITGGNTGSTGGTNAVLDNRQPTLGFKWLISFTGIYPTPGSEIGQWPSIGEIRIIAGTTLEEPNPNDYRPLDGTLYDPNVDNTLFNLITTTYGGNGTTTFAVPDMRSRVAVAASTTLAIGTNFGQETITLTITNLPAHAHELAPEIGVQESGIDLLDNAGLISYGEVGIASPSVKTFTVTNTGGADLTLSNITKNGSAAAEFTVGAFGSSTLAPGASTTFTVTFTPSASGTRSAAIHIPSNDNDENPFDIALEGEGVNTPPEFTMNESYIVVNEGTLVVNGGTFYDANGNGTTFMQADMGTISQNYTNGTWTWSFEATDGFLTYSPTIFISDGIDFTSQYFQIDVLNVAPTGFPQEVTTEMNVPVHIHLEYAEPGADALGDCSITVYPMNGYLSGTLQDWDYYPGENFTGTDSFTFQMADDDYEYGPEATVTITIAGLAVTNTAPVLDPLTNLTVNAGAVISFTATATDAETNNLSFEFPNAPEFSLTGTNGDFYWRPHIAQANTTNVITVIVTDDGLPTGAATNSFMIVVNPLEPVTLSAPSWVNQVAGFTVNGMTGPDYVVLMSTNLLDWIPVFTNSSPATPFEQLDPTATDRSRSYRVRLQP